MLNSNIVTKIVYNLCSETTLPVQEYSDVDELYIYKKIIFYLNLNEIENNNILYDLRYIILSYVHSDFKFIKFNNTQYEIFFDNEKMKKNTFFKKLFKKKEIYIKINKNINEKNFNFLKSFFYTNYFEDMDNFISYCSDMNLKEFKNFTSSLDFFNIILYPEFKEFFYIIVNEYNNHNIIDIEDINFRTLLHSYFNN